MFYSKIVVTGHLYLEMQQKEIEVIEITIYQEDKQYEIHLDLFYNKVCYNTVLDITLFSVGPQLDYFCYMSIHIILSL